MIFKIVLINCDLMICVFGNSFVRSSVETRHCLVSTFLINKMCGRTIPTYQQNLFNPSL